MIGNLFKVSCVQNLILGLPENPLNNNYFCILTHCHPVLHKHSFLNFVQIFSKTTQNINLQFLKLIK